MIGVFLRRGEDTQAHIRTHTHMRGRREAEIEVIQIYTKACSSHQKLEEASKKLSLELSEGARLYDTLI